MAPRFIHHNKKDNTLRKLGNWTDDRQTQQGDSKRKHSRCKETWRWAVETKINGRGWVWNFLEWRAADMQRTTLVAALCAHTRAKRIKHVILHLKVFKFTKLGTLKC
ncbi:Uncharacterised protein r2_g3546 [Pycnogonum litorale]